jgi:hypothetical protein
VALLPWHYQADSNLLPRKNIDLTLDPGTTDRQIEGDTFDLMGIPQQQALELCRNSTVLSPLHQACGLPTRPRNVLFFFLFNLLDPFVADL